MIDPGAAFTAALPVWSFGFVLLLARVAGAVFLLPGLGEAALPPMVRAGLAFALTLLLLPVLLPLMPPVPPAGLQLAAMTIAELFTGLWLGWLARVFALALPMAGQFIAYQLGLSTVLTPSAELGSQSSILAQLFELAVPVLILVSGLYTLPLLALAGSYRLIPPGTLLPAPDGTATAVHMVGSAFALALRLAAPFVLAGIVWQVAIGLMTRLVPRVQVYFATLPGQILGGLLLLAVLADVILQVFQEGLRDALIHLPGLG